jgi:hypothetical protein
VSVTSIPVAPFNQPAGHDDENPNAAVTLPSAVAEYEVRVSHVNDVADHDSVA